MALASDTSGGLKFNLIKIMVLCAMKTTRPEHSTPYLADILELLVILRTTEDHEAKEYVFDELKRFFAQPRSVASSQKKKAA